ncbi:MAG: potassium channel protein [Pirellulaceae bacterium]|nr:potassium channel protein [Pirellulaceae bacterium]
MLTSAKPLRPLLANEELKGAIRCLAILIAVIAFGTIGFMLVERDWSLWKSLFFTLITITTVGYGDDGLSPNGEVFAAVLLLVGIGTATYSLSSLVQLVVTHQTAWKRKMQNKIDRLSGHFLICGFGRIGQTLAQQLSEAGVPFVIIDCDSQVIDNAIDAGYLGLIGNSSDDEILRLAGIDRARGIVCAINSDAENTFVTLCAREMNPDLFIASRASTERSVHRIRRAGANVVVSPYTTAGQTIADAILRPRLSEFLRNQRNSNIELSEVTVTDQSAFAGHTVGEVDARFPKIAFVAIKRGEITDVRPGGDEHFTVGDTVTMAGSRAELEAMYCWNADAGRSAVGISV